MKQNPFSVRNKLNKQKNPQKSFYITFSSVRHFKKRSQYSANMTFSLLKRFFFSNLKDHHLNPMYV